VIESLPDRPLSPSEVRTLSKHDRVFSLRGIDIDGVEHLDPWEPSIQLLIEIVPEDSGPLTTRAATLDVDDGTVTWRHIGEYPRLEVAREALEAFRDEHDLRRLLQEAGVL